MSLPFDPESLLEHREFMQSLARKLLADEHRAEDVVQDVLRQLIERGPAFVPQDDSQFRRLVATIVLNRLRDRNDYVRAARRDRARGQEPRGPDRRRRWDGFL